MYKFTLSGVEMALGCLLAKGGGDKYGHGRTRNCRIFYLTEGEREAADLRSLY